MTQYEMAEKLANRMNVSLEEAKQALEANGWEMLDAALALEKEHGQAGQGYTTKQASGTERTNAKQEEGWRKGMRKFWNTVRELVRKGNSNRFEIRRGNEILLELPVTALAVLLIAALWACIIVLIVGLFLGFRYSFSGPDLSGAGVNEAMDKAAQTAERVKEEFTAGRVAREPEAAEKRVYADPEEPEHGADSEE